jgi:hypothetical protein
MQWSDLPLNPSDRTLRQFAGLWILFFGGFAVWQYIAHSRADFAMFLGALAITIGPLGLAFPRAIKPIFVGWLALAFPIGWVVSRVLLMVLFFVVLTPVALVAKTAGRDVLALRRRSDVTTYWKAKEQPVGISSYFRQY